MILEVAQVNILPGHSADFEHELPIAVDSVLTQAKGFIRFTGHGWCVERPNTYMFTIEWETLEDHTVGFRRSDLFAEWRLQIGHHFESAPHVEHFAK